MQINLILVATNPKHPILIISFTLSLSHHKRNHSQYQNHKPIARHSSRQVAVPASDADDLSPSLRRRRCQSQLPTQTLLSLPHKMLRLSSKSVVSAGLVM